jgi:hypothetical protein
LADGPTYDPTHMESMGAGLLVNTSN